MTETTAPTTAELLDEIEQRHEQYITGASEQGDCRVCNQPWPCDAAKLARALRLAHTALERIAEGPPEGGTSLTPEYEARAALQAMEEARDAS